MTPTTTSTERRLQRRLLAGDGWTRKGETLHKSRRKRAHRASRRLIKATLKEYTR